jgi:peptidoglycan endopeptidase LytF
MSRRDTIIIAVLVNAGLLLVLFTTALPSNDDESVITINENVMNTETLTMSVPIKSSESSLMLPADEVDMVLSEWNIKPGEGSLEIASEPAVKLLNQNKSSKTIKSMIIDSEDGDSSLYSKVIVKKGDVLEKIAKNNQTSVSEITKLNQLSASSTLQVGQVLKVPKVKDADSSKKNDGDSKLSVKKSQEKKGLKSQDKDLYYTVKSGDSPWVIANKNDIQLEELLKLNDLDDAKARKLKPGDRIRIK